MAAQPKKKFRYAIHLATKKVTNLDDFLTEKAGTEAEEIPARSQLKFKSKLFYRKTFPSVPGWAKTLNQTYEVEKKIESASASAVILFECEKRVMACTYGHGHVMLDSDKRENDFGLLIAANSLSDANVKLVEKANLGSILRDATQAANITKLQEFNVDRALSLIRRVSGSSEVSSSLSGATSITLMSEMEVSQLDELGKILLKLFNDKSYQKTGFGIIDKIKQVHDINLLTDLDNELVSDLQTASPSFELGVPEIETKATGHITISGTGKRTKFVDVNLATALEEIGGVSNIDDLYAHRVITYNIDGTGKLKEWSLYRGLIGSIDLKGKRYALNEGRWYRIDDALLKSANLAFQTCSKGLDKTFPAWAVTGDPSGKNQKFEREETYNQRICKTLAEHLLFDQDFVPIPNTPGPGIEICDVLDVNAKKLIHVKRSGRRSSVISHFLNQGMNSAKLLKQYPKIKDDFFKKVEPHVSAAKLAALKSSFPEEWTVEFKFGDLPNSKGDYTIPFFSRVALDEAKREIEALGFKEVVVSFVRLSKQTK